MPDEKDHYLIEHFFRIEYGKMLAVISKFVDFDSAEDIVQDTLMAATEHWTHRGTPPNPQAWLYKTAKNKAFNHLRTKNYEREYQNHQTQVVTVEIRFSDEQISDELLRMMLTCCQASSSKEIAITLILKILCGFSISEIASAFYTSSETINKRLVRGRKRLKSNFQDSINLDHLNDNIDTLLKVIYLLFNEGYFPADKRLTLRKDLCLEAIRLAEIIADNQLVSKKENTYALLALMYLNCSRFEARTNREEEMIELAHQNRTLWSQDLMNRGLSYLGQAQQNNFISQYLILAGISGHHCIAKTYEDTNWEEILSLYDALLTVDSSSIVRLNRVVALSKVKGALEAITELQQLKGLDENYLFYAVLAQLRTELGETVEAVSSYQKAIALSVNPRNVNFLSKKMDALVPDSNTRVY